MLRRFIPAAPRGRRAIFCLLALAVLAAGWTFLGPHSAAPRLRGVVRYTGPRPAPRWQSLPTGCTATGDLAIPDRRLVLSADGGVANVLVRVVDPPSVRAPSATATRPAVVSSLPALPLVDLTFRDFDFDRRAAIVWSGQPLRVRNASRGFTNARSIRRPALDLADESSDGFNVPLEAGGKPFTYCFIPTGHVEVCSDIFAQARASLLVTDHPWVAATDADGRFDMPALPPGTYTLETLHPLLGPRQFRVEVRPSAVIEVVY